MSQNQTDTIEKFIDIFSRTSLLKIRQIKDNLYEIYTVHKIENEKYQDITIDQVYLCDSSIEIFEAVKSIKSAIDKISFSASISYYQKLNMIPKYLYIRDMDKISFEQFHDILEINNIAH